MDPLRIRGCCGIRVAERHIRGGSLSCHARYHDLLPHVQLLGYYLDAGNEVGCCVVCLSCVS